MKKGDLVKVKSGMFKNFVGWVYLVLKQDNATRILIKDDLGNKVNMNIENVEVL